MNFKTIVRAAKLPDYKKYFATKGHKVACADGYIMVWEPSEDRGTWDVDDNEIAPPPGNIIEQHAKAIELYSPPLSGMVKINSDKLRRIISAIETKGQAPLYLQIKDNYICMAYEQDGVLSRGAVACMENEHATDC